MAWRSIGLLALNDLRLTVKNRAALVWMLLLPLAMMWLFGQTGGSSGPPKISLSVADEDGGWLADALVAELDREQLELKIVGDDPEATHLRTLVLPPGMTEKVLAGEPQELRLELDPEANRSFGRGAEVNIFRGLVRLQGRLLELRLMAPEATPSEELEVGYRRLRELPPLVRLEVRQAGQGKTLPSGYAQSVPGMLTMIVLMMTLIYGGVFLIVEKQQGMLRRQASLPMSRSGIVLSKIIGRLGIAALQTALLLLAARFIFAQDLGSSWLGLLLLTGSYAVAVAGLSILLGSVLHTPEQASTVGWILSMVLAGLGGCWWPGELMPDWLQNVARLLPTRWAMEGFHALISYGYGVAHVVVPSLVLLGFGALFITLAVRFLRLD